MSLKEIIEKKMGEIKSIELAKKHLKNLLKRIEEEEITLEQINALLDQKIYNLHQLEQLNVKQIFSRVLINKELELEKSRQEYLELFLAFKEAKKQIELLSFEKVIIQEKINNESNLKFELEILLGQREQELLKSPNEKRAILRKYQLEQDRLIKLKREIYEALIAGASAKKYIIIVNNYLQKSANLRKFTFELSTSKQIEEEKSYIDLAMQEFYKLKPSVLKFELELKDVYEDSDLKAELKLNLFKNFSKTYYHNLVHDWVIFEKINHTLKLMRELETKILDNMDALEASQTLANKTIAEIEVKRKKLLEG